jgi:hypothetical protein
MRAGSSLLGMGLSVPTASDGGDAEAVAAAAATDDAGDAGRAVHASPAMLAPTGRATPDMEGRRPSTEGRRAAKDAAASGRAPPEKEVRRPLDAVAAARPVARGGGTMAWVGVLGVLVVRASAGEDVRGTPSFCVCVCEAMLLSEWQRLQPT